MLRSAQEMEVLWFGFRVLVRLLIKRNQALAIDAGAISFSLPQWTILPGYHFVVHFPVRLADLRYRCNR